MKNRNRRRLFVLLVMILLLVSCKSRTLEDFGTTNVKIGGEVLKVTYECIDCVKYLDLDKFDKIISKSVTDIQDDLKLPISELNLKYFDIIICDSDDIIDYIGDEYNLGNIDKKDIIYFIHISRNLSIGDSSKHEYFSVGIIKENGVIIDSGL